jgi:hypothetical protein
LDKSADSKGILPHFLFVNSDDRRARSGYGVALLAAVRLWTRAVLNSVFRFSFERGTLLVIQNAALRAGVVGWPRTDDLHLEDRHSLHIVDSRRILMTKIFLWSFVISRSRHDVDFFNVFTWHVVNNGFSGRFCKR